LDVEFNLLTNDTVAGLIKIRQKSKYFWDKIIEQVSSDLERMAYLDATGPSRVYTTY